MPVFSAPKNRPLLSTPHQACVGPVGLAAMMFTLGLLAACSDSDPAAPASGTGGQNSPSTGGTTAIGSGGAATGGVGAGDSAGGTNGASGGAVVGSTGGEAAAGGSGARSSTGGASSTGGGGNIEPVGDCTFEVTHSMSEVIGTVGIVEFSVDLSALDAASIEFGLDTSYGMTAPVDLEEPNHRTLLLGMKTDSEYHFRINVGSGSEQCSSQDFTLTTVARPEDVVAPEITTPLPDERADGFLITSRWGDNNGGPAFILDADSDLVWWYFAPIDVMRVRMSYDGKYLWLRNTAQVDGTGAVMRLSLDGLEEDLWELPRTTHDLAVLPDGKVALIQHTDGCDQIIEFDPETEMTTTIFNLEDAHGNTMCHLNYVAYSDIDDSYYVSDFTPSSFVKISRAGELQWILNGPASTISGTSWERQHGIHVLAADHFVIFSNGGMVNDSLVLEYQLNESGTEVTELWRYDPGVRAQFGGDVQRLENGNTLISYSSASQIHEVNAAGELVQQYVFPEDHTVSYISKRPTLYGGPPPKIHALNP